MEFIDGRSLADILREGKPLDRDHVIAIAADVGSALAYAHRRQISHRDVKPSNILISTAGRVLLRATIARPASRPSKYPISGSRK